MDPDNAAIHRAIGPDQGDPPPNGGDPPLGRAPGGGGPPNGGNLGGGGGGGGPPHGHPLPGGGQAPQAGNGKLIGTLLQYFQENATKLSTSSLSGDFLQALT